MVVTCPECKTRYEIDGINCGKDMQCQCGSVFQCPGSIPIPLQEMSLLKAKVPPRPWYHWLFVGFGVLIILFGMVYLLEGLKTLSVTDASSIPAAYTTPAAFLFCIGLFCAIAPFCKKSR